MFSSLRSRLVLSHVLPLLVVAPLIWYALTYVIETQFLLPQLTEDLKGDARLLAQFMYREYIVRGDPFFFETLARRLDVNPDATLMYLTVDGRLLFSSEPRPVEEFGQVISLPGLEQVQTGEEVVLTSYTSLDAQDELIQVLMPVQGDNGQMVGIVRVTYRDQFMERLFTQFRLLVAGILLLGLAFGAASGSALALNIGKPVQSVTTAIYDLGRGERSDMLSEEGPDEMRGLARAVNFLVGRLHNLEQARSQLLANLVHELGRPLGALRSAIQALAQGAAQDPQLLNDLVNGMDEETARLQRLLEDLAHLHDQVLGTLELHRETLHIEEWLPRALAPWQEAAREKHLKWGMAIEPDLPPVQADPLRLGQVIGNLVSNAIRYTPIHGAVSMAAGKSGDEVWLRISDSGPGIPVEEQEKVFAPFYRGQYGRRIKQGMGLGLSIARTLVEAHGGRLELESTPGEGSKFTAWLPLDEDAD